jgi:hypothetical protein
LRALNVAEPPPLDTPEDHWLNAHWRPWMAIQYLLVCLFDFIFFPILSALYQATWKLPYTEWHPLTLQGGGLYHIAMGAIITATAYGRTQEKIAQIKSEYTYTATGGKGG